MPLDVPVHLLASRLFEAQRSEYETHAFVREFTHVERRDPLQRRFLKQPIAVLLTFRADCSHFALKSAHHSRYLPTGSLEDNENAVNRSRENALRRKRCQPFT
jgi:hypothetical protein